MDTNHACPMILRGPGAGDILRTNAAFGERLGWTSQDVAATPLLDWIHPEDGARFAKVVQRGEGRVRARHRDASGEWVPFDWQVRTHQGEVVALGLGVEAQPASAHSPRPAPSREGSTITQTLDAMARIVEAKNPGLKCSILLLTDDLESVTVGAGPSLPAAYNELVEGLRIGPAVGSCGTAAFWNVPVVVEDIERDPLWKELRAAARVAGVAACWSHPITTMEGQVLGAMALYDVKPGAPTRRQMDALDIAARMVGLAIERDRLEEQLRQASKMKALGVLAGGIAHDFNNMLVAIMGNAELAMLTLPEGASERALMEDIVTASARATDLCNQMLVYAGRGALSTEPLECNALVTELGGLLRVALSKKASLVNDLSDEDLGVTADRTQLRQVLMNLITNASEAIGNTEGQIVISTCARRLTREDIESRFPTESLDPGEYVRISVSDTGEGMGPATQARIFDPFFTTKPTGHGLGLAAVQGIVRGHGGVITLESTPGVGTSFHVFLPRVPLGRNSRGEAAGVPSGEHRGRILLVDDEPAVRRVLASTLERFGHTVTIACDGQQAIDVFRAEGGAFDCVVLDFSMPRLDGEEVQRQLRELRDDVAVILTSGFLEQDVMDRLAGAGFVGFVQKPARAADLMARVDEALRRSCRLGAPGHVGGVATPPPVGGESA